MKNITGDWEVEGDCILKDPGKGCGEGLQNHTRNCIDGNIDDICTIDDRHKQTPCNVDCTDGGNEYFDNMNNLDLN